MHNDQHEEICYNIYCLFSPDMEEETRKSIPIIKGNLTAAFNLFGAKVSFHEPKSCSTAFNALSECKNINLRFFSTTNECYSEHILNYASHFPEHRFAINIQIVKTSNYTSLIRYNPISNERTINISQKEVSNIDFINSLVKSIISPPMIYVSYGNDSNGEARNLIKNIEQKINIALPYANLIYDFQRSYKSDMPALIQEIQKSDYAILIINDRYLESEYSMAELSGILKNSSPPGSFREKIFPIVLTSGEIIYDKKKMAPFIARWQSEINDCSAIIKETPETASALNLSDDIKQYKEIINNIKNIKETVGRLAAFTKEVHTLNNFVEMIWSIYESSCKKNDISLYNKNDFSLYNNKSELKQVLSVTPSEHYQTDQISKETHQQNNL